MNELTKLYKDTENGNIITEDELFAEFISNSDICDEYLADYGDDAFPAYIANCTSKNGFLERVR